jgi:exosortase C (VPDSG-CTERM-specific)
MTETQQLRSQMPWPLPIGLKRLGGANRLRRFTLATGFLVLCFAVPLWNLVRFAVTNDFHSYILPVPFIILYVVWLRRGEIPDSPQPARLAAGVFLLAGLATLVFYWISLRSRLRHAEDDYLAVMMVAFLLLFFGVCCLFWGRETLRPVSFPLGLLVFMVPIPAFAMPPIESFLQNGSAVAADVFFSMSGTPYFRDGLVLHLPDISLQIARDCSGIQSSIVLLFNGLLASYLFLQTPWKRVLLTLLVIPLALIRNGFRVFTLGELCVHWGPQMIDSPIHHRGGPVFFLLSLVPLIILLVVLRNSEQGLGKSNLETSK